MNLNVKNRIKRFLKNKWVMTLLVNLVNVAAYAGGQGTSGDMQAGKGAIAQVSKSIASYIPEVQTLLYAIAGVVALGGAISVYIKMNNEEQDVKKSIMMIIGACIFLIAAAEALPAFFGY